MAQQPITPREIAHIRYLYGRGMRIDHIGAKMRRPYAEVAEVIDERSSSASHSPAPPWWDDEDAQLADRITTECARPHRG